MKIKKGLSKSKLFIISAIALVVILIAYTVVAHARSYWPFPNSTTSTNTKEEAKKDNSNVAGQTDQTKATAPIIEDEPTEPAGNGAKLTITQLTQENTTIFLKASLENVSDGGHCIAYFSSEGGNIAKYTTLSNTNGVLTCSLETSALEFSYLGTWSVRLVYSTPDDKKVEATGDIVIQ